MVRLVQDASGEAALPNIENGLDTLLMSFAEGLSVLENAAVDETHDNLRTVSVPQGL